MTRMRDLAAAVRRHYENKPTDARERNNERYRYGNQDAMRELSARVDADPTLIHTLNPQQKAALGIWRIRQARLDAAAQPPVEHDDDDAA